MKGINDSVESTAAPLSSRWFLWYKGISQRQTEPNRLRRTGCQRCAACAGRNRAGKPQRAGQGHPEGACECPAHSPAGPEPPAPAQSSTHLFRTGSTDNTCTESVNSVISVNQEGIKRLLRKSSGMKLQEGIMQSQVSLLLYFKRSFYKKYF